MVDSPAARLARHVKARREQRAWSQGDVVAAGGPSHTVLGRVERGELGIPPRPSTLRKLDAGLRWQPGSAAQVLAGGDPVPADTWPTGVRLGPESIELTVDEITSLIRVTAMVLPALPDGEAKDSLRDWSSKVTGRWVTMLLERNGGPDAGHLPPLLELSLGELLDRPPESTDPSEREEQRYRRWLAGRRDDIDAATAARFRRRWKGIAR